MRLLHVSQPVTAGVAEVAAHLVVDQVGRGWDVHLACPDGPLADRAAAAGARVHRWAATRSPGPNVLREVRDLARVVDTVAPDVLHLHSSKAGLAGRLAVRGRLPTIFQPHLWSFQVASGPLGTASRIWERFAARWTRTLLCVGDDELAVGRAAGVRGTAVVVPNGIDTEALCPGDRAAARVGFGLPDAPTVVCVGRITEQKGQDLLLEAWPGVRERVPGARLVLVGDGPAERRWRALPGADHESVTWAGSTATPAPWYHAADVVVLPSRSEGMALVPLEAMACARPVVAFDVGGVRQCVTGAGAVVGRGDLAGLVDALADRLREPRLAAAEGDRGRRRAEREFDRRVAAGRTAALVRDLVPVRT